MKSFVFSLLVLLCFNSRGQIVETVLSSPSIADGMCIDRHGNVYTTSGGLAGFVVGRYTPISDTFIPDYITGLTGPTDVEFLSDSVLCITNYDTDRISAYNLNSGVLTTLATGLDGPGGIETDSNGYVYVTNWGNAPQYAGHTITKISPSGNSWTYIDTSALYRPQAITWNHERQLVVHSNSNLYKINAADSTLQFWVSLPVGVANMVYNSSDSCIYGASPSDHQILKITKDGAVSVFAGSSSGYQDGPISNALFEATLGLTFSLTEDTLYVSEAGGINRLRRIVMNPSDPIGLSDFATTDLGNSKSHVYPNPLMPGSALQIENRGTVSIDQVVITNSKGQLLYTHFSDELTTSISNTITKNFSTETLFVKVIFTDGSFEIHKVLKSN